PFTVIGVMKSGLRLPPIQAAPAVWIPLGSDPMMAQVKKMFPSTWDTSAYLVPLWGRIAPGHSLSIVQEQVREAGMLLLIQDDPGRWQEGELRITSVERQLKNKYALETRILVLAALLVLAVACFNASGLILARALSQRIEIAVRLALGETRLLIAARILFEGMAISVLGGLTGILAAVLALRALESIVPSGLLPYRNITLNKEVV